jgi:hypothetical protein
MSDDRRLQLPVQVKMINVQRHATELLDLLVDSGPLTSADICDKLGWSRGRLSAALRFAREQMCPGLELTIPAPTPSNGWLYQVTTEWVPIEAGAAYVLGQVDGRLGAILRDVDTVLPLLPRGTKQWRRANFLSKHLSHLLATLSEINDG